MTGEDSSEPSPLGVSSQDLEAITPPHSLRSEQSVLGALLLDNQAWYRIADHLERDDFYRQEHRLIYGAIQELLEAGREADVVTVSSHLEASKVLDQVGGLSYIGGLVQNTPSASNVRNYADTVHERSVLRRLIEAAREIVDTGYNTGGRRSQELLEEAQRLLEGIADATEGSGGGFQSSAQLVAGVIERLQSLYTTKDGITGLNTGLMGLNQMTAGLQPGQLIVVAGRPGMGKTTLAMNIVENTVMKVGQPAVVFSMEMSGVELMMRMLAALGQIPLEAMVRGRLEEAHWARLEKASSEIKGRALFIDSSPSLTLPQLQLRCRTLVRREGQPLGLIMVDYLQLIQGSRQNDNRTSEITEISRALKAVAREFECPVLAVSQLNRSVEQRANRRPVMSDLRDSGSIEQDADLILFLYRDEVYNEDSEEQGIAELHLAKHRNGATGHIRLRFLKEYSRFADLAPEHLEQDVEHYLHDEVVPGP